MTTQTIREVAASSGHAAADGAPSSPRGGAAGARAALSGGGTGPRPTLDRWQLEALAVMATGATQHTGGRMLGISPRSYRRRLAAVVETLGAGCPINALFLAAAHGLLTPALVTSARRGELRRGARSRRMEEAAEARRQRKRDRVAAYARHRRTGRGPRSSAEMVGIGSPAARKEYEAAYQKQIEGER